VGNFDDASAEKNRLEEKQRAARKEEEKSGIPFEAKYFTQEVDDDTGDKLWKYGRRDYWEDRKKGDFAHLEDIFWFLKRTPTIKSRGDSSLDKVWNIIFWD